MDITPWRRPSHAESDLRARALIILTALETKVGRYKADEGRLLTHHGYRGLETHSVAQERPT